MKFSLLADELRTGFDFSAAGLSVSSTSIEAYGSVLKISDDELNFGVDSAT